MKYIKLFEERSPKSQFYTEDEIKEFLSLSRRLKYNINKYLEGDFVRAYWCDNQNTPISIYYTCYDYGKYYSQKQEINEEKMNAIRKSAIKIGVNKRELVPDSGSFLLTKEQAKRFLSDAKFHFYDYEMEDLTKKYNL